MYKVCEFSQTINLDRSYKNGPSDAGGSVCLQAAACGMERTHHHQQQTTNQHRLTSNVAVCVKADAVPVLLRSPVQQRHTKSTC